MAPVPPATNRHPTSQPIGWAPYTTLEPFDSSPHDALGKFRVCHQRRRKGLRNRHRQGGQGGGYYLMSTSAPLLCLPFQLDQAEGLQAQQHLPPADARSSPVNFGRTPAHVQAWHVGTAHGGACRNRCRTVAGTGWWLFVRARAHTCRVGHAGTRVGQGLTGVSTVAWALLSVGEHCLSRRTLQHATEATTRAAGQRTVGRVGLRGGGENPKKP